MARGRLRIYLGAAPGVGKTVAMLAEGRRRQDRGTDVVIGILETHGRSFTAGQADGLDGRPPPRRRAPGRQPHRARRRRRPRPDDPRSPSSTSSRIRTLRARRERSGGRTSTSCSTPGIDVISTVNIQHLESLNDVVEAITGVVQRETVPDEVVRSADQIELVDMSPESLRRRMSHGNIYPADRIDAALANYFRPGNLSALRELALLWLADRVDETLEQYRAAQGISAPWPTRERIVVALTGGPEGETVLRRAAQIASRGAGSELLACHVSRPDGLVDADPEALAAQRKLVKELGGVMHEVAGSDVAESILDVARGVNATPDRPRHQPPLGLARLTRRGVGEQVAAASGDIDVHLVSHTGGRVEGLRLGDDGLGRPAALGRLAARHRGRRCGHPRPARHLGRHELPLEVLLFLSLTVATALVGGLLPAIVCAVVSSLVINWFFTDPNGTLTIQSPQNALGPGGVRRRRGRRSRRWCTARPAAATPHSGRSGSRGSSPRSPSHSSRRPSPLLALLERARTTFGMRAAALVAAAHDPRPVDRGRHGR